MKPGESFTSERANPALHISDILHPPSHRTRDRDHVSQLTLMKLRETGLSLSLSLCSVVQGLNTHWWSLCALLWQRWDLQPEWLIKG